MAVFHARSLFFPPLREVEGVTVGVLSEDEATARASDLGELDSTLQACRAQLARGELAIAAWADGRLVGTIWYAFGPTPAPELGGTIFPTPNSVYVYHANVAPAWKGRGVAELMGAFAVPLLYDRGVQSGWMTIALDNTPSLNVFAKAPMVYARYDVHCVLTPFGRRFHIEPDDPQLRAFLGLCWH